MTNVKNLPFDRRIEEHSLIHIFNPDSSALISHGRYHVLELFVDIFGGVVATKKGGKK